MRGQGRSILENILNFHAEDDCYYEEWFSELEIGGWIVPLNFREHVIDEMKRNYIMHYFEIDERFNNVYWRKFEPEKLVDLIEEILLLRLGAQLFMRAFFPYFRKLGE